MPIEAFFIKIHSDVPKNDLNDSTVRLRGINAMFYSLIRFNFTTETYFFSNERSEGGCRKVLVR